MGRLLAALQRNGWPTVTIEGDDAMPDCVFVEDTVVMFGDLAVITNPRQPARNPEIVAVQRVIADLGLESTPITEGTMDGGDVLKVGSQIYVGISGTTTAAAIEQLARILAPRGYTVTGVPLTKALHCEKRGHGAARWQRSSAGNRWWTTRAYSPRSSSVPEEQGAHVVILDDDVVLMSSAARTHGGFCSPSAAIGSRPWTSRSTRSSRDVSPA